MLNLGNLAVKTVDSVLQPNLSFEEKALDKYDISLSRIKLSYFPSIEYYNTYIASELDELLALRLSKTESSMNKYYHTIEEFSINIGVTLVKGPAQGKINKPNVLVNGSIDQINLKLNPSIYKKLLKMSECFAVPAENQRVSLE